MLNFLRYFGIPDLEAFERMTVREYSFRMLAIKLQRLDQQELIHQQAWANWQVQATKSQGKKEIPVYRTFKNFFDKEKFEHELLGIEKSGLDKKLIQLMKKANQ